MSGSVAAVQRSTPRSGTLRAFLASHSNEIDEREFKSLLTALGTATSALLSFKRGEDLERQRHRLSVAMRAINRVRRRT